MRRKSAAGRLEIMTRILRDIFGLVALSGVVWIGLAGAAMAQSATDLNCKKCVGKRDLAKKAVAFNRLNRALQKRIKDLERQMAALQALADLAPFVSVVDVIQDVDGVPTAIPTIRLEGVNLQIVNGTGQTRPVSTVGPEGPNGLGNLIIGYDEARTAGGEICSDGRFDTMPDCEANGAIWAIVHKSGTHSLVVGRNHNYSQHANVVFGAANNATGRSATVTGGEGGLARGQSASISGGQLNTAGGFRTHIGGGLFNETSGESSSVSGGQSNTANAIGASVSGGLSNTASEASASVSGGFLNTASGVNASVLGGNSENATMTDETIPPIPPGP